MSSSINEKHFTEQIENVEQQSVTSISEQKISAKGIDEANKILDGDEDLDFDEKEIKLLVRKINWTILPFIAVCYTFFYVDKTTLSYAAIFGVKEDLNLVGDQYSWLSSTFYFGYLAFAFITNYFLLRFPVGKYLGLNIFLWGVFLMIQASCKNFQGLLLVRLVSGLAEAVGDPAFLLITSMYYTSLEQPMAISTWFSFNGLGIAAGGLMGYGIGNIKGSLSSWKYEFIIIGALCAIWGIVVFLFLPDNPIKAVWFTHREKKLIAWRIKNNQTGMETKTWKWEQFREAMLDVKVYCFFLLSTLANTPNGGISNFGTIIIKSMGFSTLGTTLLQVPYGAFISLCILSCAYINDYFTKKKGWNVRTILICIYILPNIAGSFSLYFTGLEHKVGRLFSYYMTGAYNASFVLILSENTSNTAGHTKKVVTNAMTFLGYCCGNLVGPFLFKESQYPQYSLGIGGMLFCNFMEIIISIFLGLHLRRENQKRDDLQGTQGPMTFEHGLEDLTDKQNLNFRYVY